MLFWRDYFSGDWLFFQAVFRDYTNFAGLLVENWRFWEVEIVGFVFELGDAGERYLEENFFWALDCLLESFTDVFVGG